MSRTSRLQAADGRIVDPLGRAPQLGRNSAGIPGGVGAVELPHDLAIGSVVWTPEDGECWSATIGAALVVEYCRRDAA